MNTADIELLVARIASNHYDLSNKFVIPEESLFQSSVSETAALNINPPKADAEKNELVGIILWTLGSNTVSANQIEAQFGMGRRASGIVERLFQMGLVSDKYHNQPRKVLPQSVEDIPAEVIAFLTMHGMSSDDIITAIRNRY